MTFLEAATAILDREDRPLHYREITQLAIERDLLSHIGKTPEVAMQTRLSSAVRRDPQGSEIIRKGPGIYALRRARKKKPRPEEKKPEPESRDRQEAAKKRDETITQPTRSHSGPAQGRQRMSKAKPEASKERLEQKASSGDQSKSPGTTEKLDAETQQRSRRRRKRRRRSSLAEGGVDLSAEISTFIKSRGGPVAISDLVKRAHAKGLVDGQASLIEGALLSVIHAENVLQSSIGKRPWFVVKRATVDLFDRVAGAEFNRVERRILTDVERLRTLARNKVYEAVRRLSISALFSIVSACLAKDGHDDVRLIRFSPDEKEAALICPVSKGEGGLTAILLCCDRLTKVQVAERARAVADLAGEVDSKKGLLVVSCDVEKAARTAFSAKGSPPLEIWDARELTIRMERVGIGYRSVTVPISFLDTDFFTGLPQ